MAIHWPDNENRKSIARCLDCDAIVAAMRAAPGRSDANVVCATCGLTKLESPFDGCDYFDVIMRVGRPIGRPARLRRA